MLACLRPARLGGWPGGSLGQQEAHSWPCLHCACACTNHSGSQHPTPTHPPTPTLPLRQDELFNLTTDEIRATAVRSRLELQVRADAPHSKQPLSRWHSACCRLHRTLRLPSPRAARTALALWYEIPQVEGSVRKVQLDNQMLDAVQPVVLAPAVEYRPSGAVSSSSKEPPLVSFSFVRSYAGSSGGRAAAQGQDGGPADGQGGDSDREDGQGSAAGSPSEAGGRGGGQAGGEGGQLDRQSIKSFKEIRLDIGARAALLPLLGFLGWKRSRETLACFPRACRLRPCPPLPCHPTPPRPHTALRSFSARRAGPDD